MRGRACGGRGSGRKRRQVLTPEFLICTPERENAPRRLQFGPFVRHPHGGVRLFHHNSTCLTQLTCGPCVVWIWWRNPPYLEGTKNSWSTKVIDVDLGARGVQTGDVFAGAGGGGSYRNVQWFRGGPVFEAHRRLYHSTLGVKVIKQSAKQGSRKGRSAPTWRARGHRCSRTTTLQKCAAVPRRARMSGS